MSDKLAERWEYKQKNGCLSVTSQIDKMNEFKKNKARPARPSRLI